MAHAEVQEHGQWLRSERGQIDPVTGETELAQVPRDPAQARPGGSEPDRRRHGGVGLDRGPARRAGDPDQGGPGYKRVSADFIQAAALLPKNPVTVAGIPVGTVTGMHLNGDHVTVDMRIQNNIDLGRIPAPSSWSPRSWVRGIWRCTRRWRTAGEQHHRHESPGAL